MRALASSTAAFEESWSDVRWSTVSWVANSLRRSDCARGQLGIGELDAGRRRLQRRLGLFELDLVGTRIDHKEKVALVHDLTVLEVNLGQRSADLGA